MFFSLEAGEERLFELRCADNVYRIIRKFGIGGHKEDLRAFRDVIRGINYNEPPFQQTGGTASKGAASTRPSKPVSFVVSASRAGKHTYSRFDLSDAAAEALTSTGIFTPGDGANHDAAFRIDAKNGECVFSLQLTPPGFRFRGEFASVMGGIRPTVAHCLVRVSGPRNADVFYDPFCGAGTVAAERAFYGHRKIFASDVSQETVETARRNLRNLGGGWAVFRADAVSTGMKAKSVDAVVSNVPWGRQVAVDDVNRLYAGFLRELRRILKDAGRAVILTDRREALERACAEEGFEMGVAAELSLHGLRPGVFTLRKKGSLI